MLEQLGSPADPVLRRRPATRPCLGGRPSDGECRGGSGTSRGGQEVELRRGPAADRAGHARVRANKLARDELVCACVARDLQEHDGGHGFAWDGRERRLHKQRRQPEFGHGVAVRRAC